MIIRSSLLEINPYVPGKRGSDTTIKLSANENLAGCAPAVRDAIQAIDLHTYPYQTHDLITALSEHLNQPSDRIMIGNGSDELLLLAGLCYLTPHDCVMSADQTFSQYAYVASVMGARYNTVALHHDCYDLARMASCLTPHTRIVFIANPNNPTGTIIPFDNLVQFLKQVPPTCLVVLDEAYHEYNTGYPDTLGLDFPNLLITRTFSKLHGLAALRLGYAIGSPKIIQDMIRVRQPFTVNSLALTAGITALDQLEFIEESKNNVIQGRLKLEKLCQSLGLHYADSQANFILIDLPVSGKQAFDYLLQHGISIRDLASFGRPNAIRVTIGLPDHVNLFCRVFTEFIQTLKVSLGQSVS